MPLPHLILRCIKALIVACLLYKSFDIILNFHQKWDPDPSRGRDYAWSSPYSGWYARSTPLNISQIQDIHFDADSLLLISSSSAWGNSIFHAAIFEPGICVLEDEVRRLDNKDFAGFIGIVKQIGENEWGTTHWNMMPGFFDLSTKLLRIKEYGNSGQHGSLKSCSAYALKKFWRARGSAKMPEVMAELFGLVDSDETCCLQNTEGDELIKDHVRVLRNEIFGVVGLLEGDESEHIFKAREG